QLQRAVAQDQPDAVLLRLADLHHVGRRDAQRLPERRCHDQGAGRHLDGALALVQEPPVGGGEPEAHQTVAVPHSGQSIPVAPSALSRVDPRVPSRIHSASQPSCDAFCPTSPPSRSPPIFSSRPPNPVTECWKLDEYPLPQRWQKNSNWYPSRVEWSW